MTRGEAIIRLKDGEPFSEIDDTDWNDALDMAIKALEQEPCEDAVSRKAVINQIFYSTDNTGDVVLGSALRERIARLPSVTPQEPKTGHWIFHEIEDTLRWYECDQCGAEAVKEYDYCHGCGAKMVEPQESER